MIDRRQLLTDLQRLLGTLEGDLLERGESSDLPEVGRTLRIVYDIARQAQRTAQTFEEWRSDQITQVAAAWVLSAVFARFLEDNRLIEPPKLAGPGERMPRARDEHELFFRSQPKLNDRDYLLAAFGELAALPGAEQIFGPHNAIHEVPNWLSGDAAGELLRFFQRIDAETGSLRHDFTDPLWDTRFLGDLYQDLSEAARKKYALLQTPEFIEEFILDRTLEPAIEEFGLAAADDTEPTTRNLRLIDPACGSGHFVLGAFRRILDRWQRLEPGAKGRVLAQRALDGVFGVDVNPYAVAIARFRLLLAAMRACGVARLADAPAFKLNLVCGDSLLHGAGEQQSFGWRDVDHATYAEDLVELRRILVPGRYHAVVANPPYITPKDRALNQAYRDRYATCHMKYSLAVPFMERIFRLAVPGGFTGQITANSFMKREFGKKLIEEFLPTVDLTHVIDTSGAYIPGHGTPTVILFGRHRKPVAGMVRAVMGIRGEPSTPDNPARGLVWSAILAQTDQPGSQSEYVSVNDSPRENFHKHPWSIGGGGASELKEQIEQCAAASLDDVIESAGFMAITGEDDVFVIPQDVSRRSRLFCRRFVVGDMVRDWQVDAGDLAIFPYDAASATLPSFAENELPLIARYFWQYRVQLRSRSMFGKSVEQHGFRWYEYMQFIRERAQASRLIVFAFVATDNHFVLDRGGKVFNRSAPVIKLPRHATVDDHLGLLGLLNSSVACFWMKQVFHDKGSTVDGTGARQTTVAFENFREFTSTGLQKFPLPTDRPMRLARFLDGVAQSRQGLLPTHVLTTGTPTAQAWSFARHSHDLALGQMISGQEELDWDCYRLYGLIDEDLTYTPPMAGQASAPNQTGGLRPPLATGELPLVTLGERAFEIVLARKLASGELSTTWFERHGSTPITDLPADWPGDYRKVVERRIELIESNPQIALIEKPEYKRRWNTVPWDEQARDALRSWLLDRLESFFDFDGRMNDDGRPTAKLDVALTSVGRLSDVAAQDGDFLQVAQLYRDDPAFDVHKLVAELVASESVPLLPILRYKPSGLRKRAQWEEVWRLQREEDIANCQSDAAPDPQNPKPKPQTPISVPPKYVSSDFLNSEHWRLRGKLDVPKERWVSFPHCEGPDGTAMIAWAGYDHLQLARAMSAYFVDVQERLGGRDDPRLVPMLAGLIELSPWLKQWHNEPDSDYNGLKMGDYFEGFINEEARQMDKTVEEIRAWVPPKKAGRRGKK